MLPKVVAPIGDCPIAFHSIRQLFEAGAQQVHCNTHYLAPTVEAQLRDALHRFGFGPERIRFWNEPELLNTGGGLARIVSTLRSENPARFARSDVLVISGDIYGDAFLAPMLDVWRRQAPAALMATRRLAEERPDVTWVDRHAERIVGFGRDFGDNPQGGGSSLPVDASGHSYERRLFSNHQIIAARAFDGLAAERVSSIDLIYRRLLRNHETVAHVAMADDVPWFNIGTYEEFAACLDSRRTPERGDPSGEVTVFGSAAVTPTSGRARLRVGRIPWPSGLRAPETLGGSLASLAWDSAFAKVMDCAMTSSVAASDQSPGPVPSPLIGPSSLCFRLPGLVLERTPAGTHVSAGAPGHEALPNRALVSLELLQRLSDPVSTPDDVVASLGLASRTWFLIPYAIR